MKLSLNTVAEKGNLGRGVKPVNPSSEQLSWAFQIFLCIGGKLESIAEMVEVVKLKFRQASFKTTYPLTLDIEVILVEQGEVPHPRRKIVVEGDKVGYWQEPHISAPKLPDEVADDMAVRVKASLIAFATNLRRTADLMAPTK